MRASQPSRVRERSSTSLNSRHGCYTDRNSLPVFTNERKLSMGVETGLGWYWHVLGFCAAVVVIISRQPGAIFHAQFFAEDGHAWFADAYNHGWFFSLFRTYNGYYQTVPRLAAALALLVPLASAPLVTNLVGLAFQALPVSLLISTRLSRWGPIGFRAVLGIAYLAMPNCSEVNVTVTNAQWHLALIACLLVLAASPQTKIWRYFDSAMFGLCGLTGPFCMLLLPIAFAMLYVRRERCRWMPIAILAIASGIQGYALVFVDSAARSPAQLGASPEWLTRLLAGHVYLGTLVGHNSLALQLETSTLRWIALIGTGLFVYWLFKAETEIRLFALFSALLLAASLRNPMVPRGVGLPAWRIMGGAPAIHYWFIPTLACSWMLVWYVFDRKSNQFTQIIGAVLLLTMTYGFVRDFRHPAYRDLQFGRYVEMLDHAKPGETLVIPENPQGWVIQLDRR